MAALAATRARSGDTIADARLVARGKEAKTSPGVSVDYPPLPRSYIIHFASSRKVRLAIDCRLPALIDRPTSCCRHTGRGSHSAGVQHGLPTALLCRTGDCAVSEHSLAHRTRPSQKLAPSVSLHLDGPRPHARLPSVRDGFLLFPPTSFAPLLTGTHLLSRCRTLTTRTRSSTRLAPATGERPESNMAAEIAACLRTQGRHVAATGNAAREDRLVLGQLRPELRETMAYTAAMTLAMGQSCAV
eukprot:scaffold81235_cov74-Phaeocystis_antarctica.AAC.3